jgi:hypothetical protein
MAGLLGGADCPEFLANGASLSFVHIAVMQVRNVVFWSNLAIGKQASLCK